MSSSTSSSDGRGGRTPRRAFLEVWLVVVLGMGLSLLLVRVYAASMGASGSVFLGRVLEARAALPRILAEEDPLVMFFGSSMTQAGFSARVFDRELAERGARAKSFNFGFGGLNPFFQQYLARRVREAFEAEGRQLELALIEFNPFQATKTRFQGAEASIDAYLGMLASPRELLEILLEDPTRGVRILTIKYLRDDVSAEMATWYFGEFLRPPIPESDLVEDEERRQRLREIGERMNERFEEEYPDWDGSQWSYDWQGAGTVPWERSVETLRLFDEYYETLRSEKHMADDLLWRVYSADILDLDFEEELVTAFIRLVGEFQRFSKRVEVVMLPRNTAWIDYSPEARARLDEVVDRIRRETGVTFRDDQEIDGITPEMFADTTHLARYQGDVPFTRLLADRYSPALGGHRLASAAAAPADSASP